MLRTFCLGAICASLLAGPPAASAPLLRQGKIVVEPSGEIRQGDQPLGQLTLPPGPKTLSVQHPIVGGHKLLHLRVVGRQGRAAELILEPLADKQPLFRGSTGDQGVDGEWQRLLEVTPQRILLFERRAGIDRCDGQPVHLFPQVYDFSARRFRPVEPAPSTTPVAELQASASPPAGLSQRPWPVFRLVAASTIAGDQRRAANLSPPREAEDDRADTAWFETLGGPGRGQFLTARSQSKSYRLRALSIIPGDAASPAAFRQANRLKTALLLLGNGRRYRVRFPHDPLRTGSRPASPYWVVLPEPLATNCASLLIEEVYPGSAKLAGGRTAISELRFFTDLDLGAGAERLLTDLTAPLPARAAAAESILSRIGPAAAELVAPLIPSAPPASLYRIVQILLRSKAPEAAATVVSALPRLPAAARPAAVQELVQLGAARVVPALLEAWPQASPELRPLLASALGDLGGAAARGQLLRIAGRGDVPLRRAVVEALGDLSQPEDLQAVLAAAQEARAPRRAADLIYALGRLGRHNPLPTAAALATRWPELEPFEPRYRLLAAVARLDACGQQPLLLEAAAAPEPELRWLALERLAACQSPSSRAKHLAALADPDPRVRASACRGLMRWPAAPAISAALARLLTGEGWPRVALAAAEALGTHCSPAGLTALRATVSRRLDGVDLAALSSLATCRPPRLAEELISLARDAQRRGALRAQALTLLPRQQLRALEQPLLRLFAELRQQAIHDSVAEQLVIATASVLGDSPTSRSQRALADALALDPNEAVRAAAALALGRSCAAESQETLRRASDSDAASAVRQSAARALQRCRSPR